MSLDPVNIDFIIGGNVDSEGKKVESQLDKIVLSAKQAKAQIRSQIVDLKEDMKQTEAVLKATEKALKDMAPGNQKLALQGTLNELKQALEIDKESLAKLTKQLDSTSAAYERLTTQLTHAKDVLAKLEDAGMRNTKEWKIARDEVERLSSQLHSVNKQTTVLADPQRGFKAAAGAVSGFTGAMTAAVGVASLFGAETEELTRIQTRLQSVMAIAIGVQQVAQNLNKESYFSVVLLTKAKHFLSAANIRLATTFGISTVAAKALMATLTLGLSVAITGVVVLLDRLISRNKEQKKLAEEAAKVQKKAAEYQKEISKQTADDYGREVTKIETLRAVLKSDTITRQQKLNIIKKLKGIIPGYVAELDKEGKVIRENTKAIDEYIQSVDKSARLKALEKEMEKLYAQDYNIDKEYEPSRAAYETFTKLRDGKQKEELLKKPKEDKEKYDKEKARIQGEIESIKQIIQKEGLLSLGLSVAGDQDDSNKKEPYNAAKDIQNQLLEINRQTADLLFQQREDNLQKTLDAIDREKKAELDKISEKEQAIIDEYNKDNKDKKGLTSVTTLDEIDSELAKQQMDAVQALEAAYAEKRKKTEEDYNKDMQRLAAEAADSRVKIANDYETQIKKAREAGLEDYAALLEGERDKKVSEATAAIITETEAYKLASNTQLEISKETTEELIELIRKRVKAELEAGKITRENAQEILNSINKTDAGKESKNNPFENLITGLKAYKEAKDKLATAKSGGASIEDVAKLEDAANKTLEATTQASGAALQGVVNILSQAVDGMAELGLLSEEEKKTADDVIGMVSGAADLAMGIASGNPMQMIQGAIQLVVNGIKLFDKKSKDIEKAQKQNKKNIQDLEREYKKLERAIGKALGTDVYKKQREQLANLQKQIDEYYKLIEQEEKKKKKKQDQNQINEWKDKIDELKAQSEDVVDNIVESLTQTSARDLASQLADSIVSAFRAGEDAAEAMGRTIDDVIRQAVINSLKLRYLEKPLEKLVNQFADDMESGGELTKAEADRFRQGVESLGGDFTKALEMANQALGGIFQDAKEMASPQGIKGDVANMSEQTGSALVGQLTAMRLNVASLAGEAKRSGESMTQIFASLERIKDNTEYCRLLERIDDNIQYLKVNGMTVK